MKRPLTQQEIDAVFGGSSEPSDSAAEYEIFDVKKLDTIPRSQLQSLHLVHENFTRNLASSLSAYFRSYVMLNLVSLEQLSYGDFLEGMSSPSCIAYIGLAPFEGTAILDLNTNLVFRLIELLLGSKAQTTTTVQRKITDIEKRLMQTLLRVVLRDLHDSWKSVAEIDFTVQSLASEPQLLYVLAPAEAMIVIAIEVRLGSTSGLMNLAIPSIFIKRLRNNFEQLQRIRKTEATADDQLHVERIIADANLNLDVHIPGGMVPAKTLMDLKPDDVLMLEHPSRAELSGRLNGKEKWLGKILTKNSKLAFEITRSSRIAA